MSACHITTTFIDATIPEQYGFKPYGIACYDSLQCMSVGTYALCRPYVVVSVPDICRQHISHDGVEQPQRPYEKVQPYGELFLYGTDAHVPMVVEES